MCRQLKENSNGVSPSANKQVLNLKKLIERCRERDVVADSAISEQRRKRDENRGVNPLFAEPNETVRKAMASTVNYMRFAQKNKTTNEEKECDIADLGLKRK